MNLFCFSKLILIPIFKNFFFFFYFNLCILICLIIFFSYNVFGSIFENQLDPYLQNEDVILSVLDFILSVSENKNQRHSYENNNNTSYLIFRDFSKFINKLCIYFKKTFVLNFLTFFLGISINAEVTAQKENNDIFKSKYALDNKQTILFYFILFLRQKIISKIWKVFNVYLKGRFINFSVFFFFNDDCFNNYLKTNIQLKFSLFPYIFVFLLN